MTTKASSTTAIQSLRKCILQSPPCSPKIVNSFGVTSRISDILPGAEGIREI